MYITKFSVRGNGVFPMDMLRYDACYPNSDDSVQKIKTFGDLQAGDARETVTISLSHRHENKITSCPMVGRWHSFGWGVVPGSVETRKV